MTISPVLLPADCRAAAAMLNHGCICRSVDHAALRRALEGEAGLGWVSYARMLEDRPNLFADTQVYVAEAHLEAMAELVRTIERVVALPAWRKRVLARAPAIARHSPGASGGFLGYDFHLGEHGPQLIEINTNAGGPLLNAALLKAQMACCAGPGGPSAGGETLDADFVSMFRGEWQRARGAGQLRRIAIVDESPESQFLAPEFELFRRLFEAHGIEAQVLDAGALSWNGRELIGGGQPIDLVYNRLTDFYLESSHASALRAAYLADAVVLTPHPQAHALYADKRNLELLADKAWLRANGIAEKDCARLSSGVPKTLEVTPDNAAGFWADRKHWFFKPAAGYGSKAAYRGDKLTRRVFDGIAQGGYIAQALVPPSQRRLLVDGVERDLKLDLRNYVYCGQVQLVSARLYRGQTTNFRTPGGGFAAVFTVACQGHPRCT